MQQAEKAEFFDMKALMKEQTRLLNSLNPLLRKVANLDNKVDTIIFRPDSTSWARELEIFQELDINKPVLWDKYVKTIQFDSLVGKEIIRFEQTDLQNSGAKYLNISLKEGKVLAIEGEYQEKSLLYDAIRSLSITFDDRSSRNRILHYSILGRQKMIFQDTIVYQVRSEIIY